MLNASPETGVCVVAPIPTTSGVGGTELVGPPITPIDHDQKCLSRATNVPFSQPRGMRQAPKVLSWRSAPSSGSPMTIEALSVLSIWTLRTSTTPSPRTSSWTSHRSSPPGVKCPSLPVVLPTQLGHGVQPPAPGVAHEPTPSQLTT